MKQKTASGKTLIPVFIAMPVLTILLSLAGAKLVLSESVRQEQVPYLVYGITILVTFLLSAFTALRMERGRLLWGLGAAGAYYCVLLLGNLLFFGEGFGGMVPIGCCVLGAGLFGGFAGAGKRRKYG